MRILVLFHFVSLGLISAVSAQSTDYPWRVESPSQTQSSPAVQSIPNPPIMSIRPILTRASFKNRLRQDGATQNKTNLPTILKAQDLDLKQVPSAPGSSGVDESGQAPGLSVQSNALRSCGHEADGCFRCTECPKRLFGKSPSGFEIGGFGQIGYHNRNNIMFNNRRDELQLQQGWLFLEKATTAENGIGFRLDTVYGVDAQDLQAFGNPAPGAPVGWDNDWDNGSYGWAIPQAYVEFGDGNSTIRAGKFLSPFGFESVKSNENFFYSRTYTRYFTEPFSNTGVIGEFAQCNGTSYIVGVTAGWDTGFKNTLHGFNAIVGVRKQLSENVRLASTTSLGDTGFRGTGILSSTVLDVKVNDRVRYVLQGDRLTLNTNDVDEFGIIQNVFYQVNPCLAAGVRLEWWKTDQLYVDTKSTWDLTFGTNYRPTANIIIRQEVRFDWGASALDPGEPMLGIDAIFSF